MSDKSSLAMAYAVKKRGQRMSRGGMVDECAACRGGECMEHGGDVVDRIMAKRMSEGGEIANDTPPIVDNEEADYDDLVLRDDLDGTQTASDEIGDPMEDERDEDMVSRIMRGRMKRDRNPRPA